MTPTSTCPFSGSAPVAPPLGLRRRRLLTLAAGVAALCGVDLGRPAAGAPRLGRAAAKLGTHGQALRGLDISARFGRDREARFGLMFKTLPAHDVPDALLRSLAVTMNDGKAPLSDVKDSDVAFDTAIPAGYVYFGQFVDHDITLDRTPLADQRQDLAAMKNFDTPCFDLASVYGGGPAANPELYDATRPGRLAVTMTDGVPDVPRDAVGAAYLGDPRNDENLLVSQLHTVFLRLHNSLLDQGMTFEQARQQCRWHLQWLIVNDYLPRIVGPGLVQQLLRRRPDGRLQAATSFYKPRNKAKPYIPVEFAGAAYRFGHSQIRAEYEVHDQHTVPIFAPDGHEDLRGNRPFPPSLWIDWAYFFDVPGLSVPDDRNQARAIDTDLSLPLASLPSTVVAPTVGAIVALAERNLLRGKRLGLPSGQDVATAMGVQPLSNAAIGLTAKAWGKKAPLWYYVLAEAELLGRGQGLGPVGGRIVAEVLLGLIEADPASYFNAAPTFDPGAGFTVGSLIVKAGAVDPRSGHPVDVPDEVVVGTTQPGGPEEPVDPAATQPLPGTV